jgi:hypothetical protein
MPRPPSTKRRRQPEPEESGVSPPSNKRPKRVCQATPTPPVTSSRRVKRKISNSPAPPNPSRFRARNRAQIPADAEIISISSSSPASSRPCSKAGSAFLGYDFNSEKIPPRRDMYLIDNRAALLYRYPQIPCGGNFPHDSHQDDIIVNSVEIPTREYSGLVGVQDWKSKIIKAGRYDRIEADFVREYCRRPPVRRNGRVY